MLIHPFTERGSAFDPIHAGNADEVLADKMSVNGKTVLHSNIKKGFQIYDLVRPSFQPQAVDPIETFCDSADMRTAQQSLPSQALKLILANSGAEMRDKKTYQLTPKERPDGSSDWGYNASVKMDEVGLTSSNLWWVSYGENEDWSGGEGERVAKWNSLKESTNGTLKKPSSGEDFLVNLTKGVVAAPKMPDTLLLGMTSQMALQLFHKLPDGALFIVDEIQKYVGKQDKPENLSSINNVVERQNFYCMLSEAVKPKGELCAADKNNTRGATNKNIFNNNNNKNNNKKNSNKKSTENYDIFCQKAAALANNPNNNNKKGKDPFLLLPHMKPLKGDSSSARRFSRAPGGGYIQGASATPSIVDLDTKASDSKSVNELERMWRLIGSCRNQVITPISRGMLKTGREITTKSGKKVTQNINMVKKAYRKKMQVWLRDSKIIISFIDLSMDVTKVPLSTRRGEDSANGSGSIVQVDLDMKNRKQRLHPLNFGNGKTVEDRIGYPTMNMSNNQANQVTKPRTTKAATTKAATTKAATRTTNKKQRPGGTRRDRREWTDNASGAIERTRRLLSGHSAKTRRALADTGF